MEKTVTVETLPITIESDLVFVDYCLTQYRGAMDRANYWTNRINNNQPLPNDFWDMEGNFRGWGLVEAHKETASYWLGRAKEAC
jgi:hypothetical protein